MRSRIAAFLAALLLPLAAAGAGEVIERILAVVDGRPVLLSEVVAMQQLKGQGASAALEATVDELLMYQEASRLPQASLSAEEEERAYRSLAGKAGAANISEAELRRMARRQLAILKYVEFRFRPQVRATDVERAEQELSEKIEAWVAELRSAAEVRYNAPAAPR